MNILISGTRKGLGKTLLEKMVSKGHYVIGFSSQSKTERNSDFSIFQCDLLSSTAEKSITENVLSCVNNLDLVINNAGTGSFGFSLEDTKLKEVEKQFQLHCLGAFKTVRATANLLIKSDYPMVCNITSRLGSIKNHKAGLFEGCAFSYSYRLAKAAQNMLTQCMANDDKLKPITFFSLNPGLLKTDSGSSDANKTADEAADKFLGFIDKIDASSNGKSYDLFEK